MRRRICSRLFRYGVPVSRPDVANDNARLLAAAKQGHWDIVWLEKALTIGPQTLVGVRKHCPVARIIGFSPDDMNGRHNQSQQFLKALPLYDYFLTTKSYNVHELGNRGCPNVVFVGNGFDPDTFRPLPVSSEDRIRLGGDVGFIGTYERERADLMYYLATQGIRVRGWGSNWGKMPWQHPNLAIENTPLYGDDFAKACATFKINLAFLRKINRDQQTTRSVEIPACGGFMLAERTDEHLELFEEGEEAEFFASREELLEKCRHYLRDNQARIRIAQRGYERCLRSGYSNSERLREALRIILGQGALNYQHVNCCP
ncbi:MAG: glycosyltransferase [bacterium]|uniref:Glycosyltransferase n=1 Tax=Candidatus Methylomirabilis tolerans TaxID=3123416 RepID=A0AAJ1AH27_9BACT|nr:glycosyltransferase [Candidatus Methylomirabilis sp.]